MVNVTSYFVKAQPRVASKWSATAVWERLGQAKKVIQDAYVKVIRKHVPESSAELSQIAQVPNKVPKQQLFRGYKTTIGGYAARIQRQITVRNIVWNGRAGPFGRDFIWRRFRTGYLFGFATLFLVHEESMEEEIGFRKRMAEYITLCDGIKTMFESTKQVESLNNPLPKLNGKINDFKIGKYIAHGCNGAVYEAEVKAHLDTGVREKVEKVNVLSSTITKSKNIKEKTKLISKKKKSNPDSKRKFAVKMMFNFSSSNAGIIYKQTRSELIACGRGALAGLSKDWQNGSRARLKHLPSHPNIMTILRAIVDKVPAHPEFKKHHPASLLPSLHPEGYGRSSTMFLIMKRYECTLQKYLVARNLSITTKYLLALQLLQGISHLERNNVAHRDLNSSNIMIEHDSRDLPRLVISDFGCSLVSESEDLIFPFLSYNDDIRNGTPEVQPPEITNCSPGPDSVLDYRKSDAWSAGLIMCEIFGLRSEDMFDDTGPEEAIVFIKRLIKMLLKENPVERLSCNKASDILHLELFGPKFQINDETISTRKDYSGCEVTIADWLLMHASETLAYRSTSWGKNSIVCEIFTNYLSAISYADLQSALSTWHSLSAC